MTVLSHNNKLDKAFQLFDSYNMQDPHTLTWDGKEYPAEYFYALQLYNWVLKLDTQASQPLLLASRCQHLGRWKISRAQYPAGKAGYLRWRSDLAKFHAAEAEICLEEAGYTESEIQEVQHIQLKKDLKSDADVQTIENALCLVFLEFQLEDFIRKHDDEKLVRILQKSWKKMSEPGRNAALGLKYGAKARNLIDKILE